jgi:hypothetical protein
MSTAASPDLSKMQHKGADFIRDFLTFHDVPKDQAVRINGFLHAFYMGTYSIGDDFHQYAGLTAPWEDRFERWEYIGRLAKVCRWLKDEGLYKKFQLALSTIVEFGFLVQTEHGEFVAKLMKMLDRWLKAVGEIDASNFEDASKIHVGVVGGRYAIEQMWVMCESFLVQRGAAKERRGDADVDRDGEVIG